VGGKEINNEVIRPVLKKMCEIAGHDYNKINWTDQSHRELTWNVEQQINFADWLYDYLLKLNINQWKQITDEMPRFYYKKPKKCRIYTTKFIYSFGFALDKDVELKKEKKK
jgi:hypothetical protein